jgi:hypothetical protein
MNPLNGIERSTSDRVTPSRDKIVNPFNGIESVDVDCQSVVWVAREESI